MHDLICALGGCVNDNASSQNGDALSFTVVNTVLNKSPGACIILYYHIKIISLFRKVDHFNRTVLNYNVFTIFNTCTKRDGRGGEFVLGSGEGMKGRGRGEASGGRMLSLSEWSQTSGRFLLLLLLLFNSFHQLLLHNDGELLNVQKLILNQSKTSC